MPTPPTNGPENGKRGKKNWEGKTHLIAVYQKREAVRVYAVLAVSAEATSTQVSALATDDVEVEIVGAVSRDMARQLGLMVPGDISARGVFWVAAADDHLLACAGLDLRPLERAPDRMGGHGRPLHIDLSEPRIAFPIGVRAIETMTASVIGSSILRSPMQQ